MALTLSHPTGILEGKIQLTASKSESNRALIIQALCEDSFEIANLSTSDDTTVLQTILNANKNELFVNLSGTAMRFSTAFCAIQTKEVVITTQKNITIVLKADTQQLEEIVVIGYGSSAKKDDVQVAKADHAEVAVSYLSRQHVAGIISQRTVLIHPPQSLPRDPFWLSPSSPHDRRKHDGESCLSQCRRRNYRNLSIFLVIRW